MPLNGLSITHEATSFTVAGGTPRVFTPDGQTVTNGLHVAAMSVTDFRIRPHISFKNRNPNRKSDGSFTQGTKTAVLTTPYLDPNTGVVHYDTITIERRFSPVIPVADLKAARYNAAQLLFVADCENFNEGGDLS